MKQIYLAFFLLLTAVLTINAAPRSKRQITDAAVQVLNSTQNGIRLAPRQERITELQSNGAVTVMGYPSGGYAIIANDDRMPAVLGYSDTKFDTSNPNFMWYLDAVSKSAKELVLKEESTALVVPDPVKYDLNVSPLLKTKWGQFAPFNNMCPAMDDKGSLPPTGCVATAMAQILYLNGYPKNGNGTKSIEVTFNDSIKKTVSVDFSKSFYDYDNMLEDYGNGYTQAQADAVAKLMLDCGVASNMSYAKTTSGTNPGEAVKGLRDILGYGKTVKRYNKLSKSNEDWMNYIFNEINSGRAVLMTGDAENASHAFVLDGYQSTGLVHVNWGWNGISDGYYDLSKIAFNTYQEIIIGLQPYYDKDSMAVSVKTPGTLSQLLLLEKTHSLTKLKVSGNINSTDLKCLRMLARRDSIGSLYPHGHLEFLDLRDANIVSGGEPYLIDGEKAFTTRDNYLPERAFYRCNSLKTILLPNTLDSVGKGSLTGLSQLDSVYVPEGVYRNQNVISGVIFNRDTTEVIMAFPNCAGNFISPLTVRKIDDYAFERNGSVKSMLLYPRLNHIGKYAMAWMDSLEEIRISSWPFLDDNALLGIKNGCKLYQPFGFTNLMWADGNFTHDKWGVEISVTNYVNSKRTYAEPLKEGNIEYTVNATSEVPEDFVKNIVISDTTSLMSEPGMYEYCTSNTKYNMELYPVHVRSRIDIEKITAFMTIDTLTYYIGDPRPVFTYKITGPQNNNVNLKNEDFRISENYGWLVTDAEDGYIYSNWLMRPGKYFITYYGKPTSEHYIVPDENITRGILTIVEKQTNGIDKNPWHNSVNEKATPVYNIQGQRVSDNYKGIVIVNGKKILRK